MARLGFMTSSKTLALKACQTSVCVRAVVLAAKDEGSKLNNGQNRDGGCRSPPPFNGEILRWAAS